MRGAAYIRVSTTDQIEFSPEAQKKAILDYARRNGIEIYDNHIYVDEGFSGRKAEKRPGFMEMIRVAKMKPRPFDLIIVHRFDRFARNREDSVVYKALLKKEQGIKVISVSEQLEDDKFSVILESMLEAMAEYYSLNLADEVRKGMKEKAIRGGFQGKPPMGYEVKEKGKPPRIIEEEAEIIRYIYNQLIEEKCELSDIAKALNEMGYNTRKQNAFETRSVEYILRNPMYCGDLRWNYKSDNKTNDASDWIITKGEHTPIIPKDRWEQAQYILDSRKTYKAFKSRPQREYKHWLSGILRCGYCGGAMTYVNTHGYAYFRCNKRLKGSCVHSNYIRVDGLQRMVLEQLEKDMQGREYFVDKLKTFHHDPSHLLMKQLTTYEKQLMRIKNAYISGVDTLEEYESNKEALMKKSAYIKQELNRYNGDTYNSSFKKKHQKLSVIEYLRDEDHTLQERNNALKAMIKSIKVFSDDNKIIIYYFINKA